MAWPHMRRCNHIGRIAFCSTSAAIWTKDKKKLLFMDGEYSLIDLKKDPFEMKRKPLTNHPLKPDIEEIAKRVIDSRIDDKQRENDELIFQQLKALGYMD
jgi:hypothetical protein